MVESAALEPLALDVVRDPVSDLGGSLDRFAGHLSDRMSGFGSGTTDPHRPSLLRSLSERWSMPGAGAGLIEVFQGSDFGGLVRHWGSRAGYHDLEYADNPFVIPIDPVEHVEGISGAHLRRPRSRRRALRPVALRSQRPSPRPRAIEQWRPVVAQRQPEPVEQGVTSSQRESTRFSAYPAAMGQAGSIDATLLRFPTAQAEISDGLDRAVVTERNTRFVDWAPAASRTPAVQAAERISADVAARLSPEAASEVGAWLVPAQSPKSEDGQVQALSHARMGQRRIDARVPISAFEARIGPTLAGTESTTGQQRAWDAGDIPGTLVEAYASDGESADADLSTVGRPLRRAKAIDDAPSIVVPGRSRSAQRPERVHANSPKSNRPANVASADIASANVASADIVSSDVVSSDVVSANVGLAGAGLAGAGSANVGLAGAGSIDPGSADVMSTRAAPVAAGPAVDALSAQIIDRISGPGLTQAPLRRRSDTTNLATVRVARPWDPPSAPAPGRALFVPAALARLATQLGEAVRPSAAPDAEWPWAHTPSTPRPSFIMADRAADGVLVEATAAVPQPTAVESGDRPVASKSSPTSDEPARPPDLRRAAVTSTIRPASRQGPEIASRVEARLGQLLSASAAHASPITLANLLSAARSAAPDAVWQAQVAADPAIARVLAQVDRLTARTSMTAPLPTTAPRGMRTQREVTGDAATVTTRLEDGLSILSGAPASATLFSPSWAKASPVVRAMLSAAGFGPEAGEQPGPSFSFGERLAAVAADMSSRHGLSTESTAAGGLDAAWFSEPTGTLVLPMAAPELADMSAGAAPFGPVSTLKVPAARRAAPLRAPDAQPGSAGARPTVRPGVLVGLPSALQAALRGARRRGPSARLRPVPKLPRMTAPIAPESMAMLTQTQGMSPAIVEVLARAERLLGGDGATAISALARMGDMPSLVSLARLAEAPEALAALSDGQQAPSILRALARLDSTSVGAAGAEPLRASRRWDQAPGDPLAVLDSLDAVLVSMAEAPAPETGGQRRGADGQRPGTIETTRPPNVPRARLAESLSTLANALPAALRAALATATAQPSVGEARSVAQITNQSRARVPATADAAQTTGAAQPTGAAPFMSTAGQHAHASSNAFATGAIGRLAQRAVDWAQRAEASAPQAFDALAIHAGDAAQSPIARRVLAPRAMSTNDLSPTLLALPGQPAETQQVGQSFEQRSAPAIGRTRAAPIGEGGRRAAAYTHSLDGLGRAPGVSGRRSIWQAPDAWTLIASLGGSPSSSEMGASATSPAPLSRSATTVTSGSARGRTTAANAPLRRTAMGVRGQRGEFEASQVLSSDAGSDRSIAHGRAAMGVPGGKLRWPEATFNWVQAAAGGAFGAVVDRAAVGRSAVGRSAVGRSVARGVTAGGGLTGTDPAAQARRSMGSAFAGIAGLRSLGVSERIFAQSLSGLGLLSPGNALQSGTDPLRPVIAEAPRIALELALPGAGESSPSEAELFADQTLARQVPISMTDRSSAARAAAHVTDAYGETPTLDVDWVRPVQATAAEAAELAPRLRSPGNINRALDVWVDAVKTEASRSPAAARRAMGSVGQLIAQFSNSKASNTRVRPSKVLRGSVFDGRSPSPVTIEAPQDGDARPTLVRPGEHAARQALRKGTDTVQTPQATTTEDARHKNSEQTDELIPPEEVERLAAEVIDRIKRELEFDAARMGEDGWD